MNRTAIGMVSGTIGFGIFIFDRFGIKELNIHSTIVMTICFLIAGILIYLDMRELEVVK